MAAAAPLKPNSQTFKPFFPSSSPTRKHPSTIIPSPPLTLKPFTNLFSFYNPTSFRPLITTFCSTKPSVDSDKTSTKNPTPVHGDSENPENYDRNRSELDPKRPSPASSSSVGLVFDLGPANSWDCGDVGSPVVKRFLSDEEERWYMWYHGASSQNADSSIGLAVSNNGVHWERGSGCVQSSTDVGLMFHKSLDWWGFDTKSVRPSDVLVMSSNKVRNTDAAVYWLYYTGFSPNKVQFKQEKEGIENISMAGLGISQDGRYWARVEGEHHTGALFDVGPAEDWDSLFIAAPRVVYHRAGDLRMYYHSLDEESGRFVVGMARSRDGIKWIKLGKILGGGDSGSFDEGGALNGHVMCKKDGGYLMAYEGVGGNGERSIGLAESEDGLKDWRRFGGGEAVLRPSTEEEDGWDNRGVESPFLVRMDGDADEWRLYYRGVGKSGRAGIGMAISDGKKIQNFRRWTGFFHL